jgi:hypothetical protein
MVEASCRIKSYGTNTRKLLIKMVGTEDWMALTKWRRHKMDERFVSRAGIKRNNESPMM